MSGNFGGGTFGGGGASGSWSTSTSDEGLKKVDSIGFKIKIDKSGLDKIMQVITILGSRYEDFFFMIEAKNEITVSIQEAKDIVDQVNQILNPSRQ
jgi:hypothetical protein